MLKLIQFLKRATITVGVGVWITGVIATCLMIAGWVMNLYKLFHHLPAMDPETVVRIIGIIPLIGGLVGWF